MNSQNKLNLKDYVQTDQALKQENPLTHSTHQAQQKPLKNQRKSSNRQSKKLKLNTLPCEQFQKDSNQMFLFRSTWEDDMQHLKEEMKGCTSPTFATQILSNANNHSSLFPFTDQINETQQESSKRTRVSNSRSKSKNNKSLQKFIGDSVSTHRPSGSTVQKTEFQMGNQTQVALSNSQQEIYLYQMKKLESVTHQLRRQNKKLDEKCRQLKERCQQLEELNDEKGNENMDNLMTNEVLMQKMKNESFWKFYLKAEKMIKASMAENNEQSFGSPINFMKQLQALREMSSEMKKENKLFKKIAEQKGEQVEKLMDKLSVQEAEVEQIRLKCVAYQSTMKRLRDQIAKNSKQLQRLSAFQQLHQAYSQKSNEAKMLSKQVSTLNSQLQEQKLLNSECEKQRLSTKKKCQQLNDEITSLNKQLSAIKTSYNLLEIQKQERSANKKELIEKERLKERVFQLEKEINSMVHVKEQEMARMRAECEARMGKEIEVKQSRVKELDSKVQSILGNISELQTLNATYSGQNKRLKSEINEICKEKNRLENENRNLEQQINEIQGEKSQLYQQLELVKGQSESRINEFSSNMKTLTQKLSEQERSVQTQEILVKQLQSQIREKEQLLTARQQSQRLKKSCGREDQQIRRRRLQGKCDKKGLSEYQRADEAGRLEEKLNEALEMYEEAHNEKVELQMQLQCAEQEVEKLSMQLERFIDCNQLNEELTHDLTADDTLQVVENLLAIKEQIIKKTLIFCPQTYKALLVQYIYCGDMIKQKYFQILNHQLNSHQNQQNHYEDHDDSSPESYLQPEDSNYYLQGRTTRNQHQTYVDSQYNQTKPYQSRNPHYDQQSEPLSENQSNNHQQQQNQINHLVDQFLKIGQIIDQQTRIHYHHPKSKDRKHNPTLHPSKQKQNRPQQQCNKKKFNPIQHSKHLLNQLNPKNHPTQQNNINYENSFHYQPASNLNKKPISKFNKQFTEDQKYPSQSITRTNKQPFQLNEDHNQQNVSRPLFTAKNIKIKNPSMMRNHYQEEEEQQRDENSIERSSMTAVQQTPYQKRPHGASQLHKDNFNHGIMSKLSMLKISDRIRQ